MNRACILAICLFIIIPVLNTGANPNLADPDRKNVLDYYRMLPHRYFSNSFSPESKKYILRKEKKGWIARSSADYDLEVVVDTSNGYIRIDDHGTGGGRRMDEVVLYIDSPGRHYICINQVYAPGVWNRNFVRILEYRNSTFSDVTRKVLPPVTLADYLRENHDQALTKRFIDIVSRHPMISKGEDPAISHLTFAFPRYGTTAKVSVNFTETDNLLFLFNGNDESAARDTIRHFLKSELKYSTMELKWNREKTIFEFGKKTIWNGK